MIGAPPSDDAKRYAIDYFRVFLHLHPFTYTNTVNTQLVMEVPFTPTSKRYQPLVWQANDPLVHYTVADLSYLAASNIVYPVIPPSDPSSQVSSNFLQYFWNYTYRYDPWGGKVIVTGGVPVRTDPSGFDMTLKDPLVRASDDWDFPTNKFPNVGWLGRVHRGTPWQTVYLKASDVTNFSRWVRWTGDATNWFLGGTNTVADASFHRPVQDRLLFDSFTAAVNENAGRGQLSVNQTNLAAWSAILSGVIVITNSSTVVDLAATPPVLRYDPLIIQPAGVYPYLSPKPPLVRIWQGINNARAALFTNQVFNHQGDVLATPQLTEQSPFLDTTKLQSYSAGGLSDEVIERIPQQIMGLLTLSHSPRFVIYSYGQTLHPADRSIYTASGPFFGLCTNYQVTAETATRAVVRVEGSFDPKYTYTPQNPDSFGHYYPPHIVVEQFNVLPPD